MPSLILLLESCERIVYPLGQQINIGRDPNSGIVLNTDRVSVNHASVSRQGGGFVVQDLGSSDGTFINGAAVTTALLKQYDIIRVAEYSFLYRADDVAAATVRAAPVAAATPAATASPASPTAGIRVTAGKPGAAVRVGSTPLAASTPSNPAASTPSAPAETESAQADDKSSGPSGGNLRLGLMIVTSITTILTTVLLTQLWTLHTLPLGAREMVISSGKFQKNVAKDIYLAALTFDEATHSEEVMIQHDTPVATVMVVPRTMRVIGRLRFTRALSAGVRFRSIVVEKKEKAEPVYSDTLEIKSGANDGTIFSVVLPPGTYNLKATPEELDSDVKIPAKFSIYIEEEDMVSKLAQKGTS